MIRATATDRGDRTTVGGMKAPFRMSSSAEIAPGVRPLATERLTLRTLTLEDAPDLFAYASDPATTVFVEWPRHETVADSRTHIRRLLTHHAVGNYHWGITDRKDTRLIGTCGFIATTLAHRRAEIVYTVAPDRWGQGIATEAAAAIIRFGFVNLDLNRIEARCLPEHAASRRVMAKLGMTFEGILRQHVLMKGRFADLAMYAVLRRDWKPNSR
jgi:ribosomal-protein-alanine N-acetyltransferase